MKTNQFKLFHAEVMKADKTSDVWYAGYLWMDLTDKQADKVSDVLWSKNCINVDLENGWFIFPNGLKFQSNWIVKVQKAVNEAFKVSIKLDCESTKSSKRSV